MECAEEIKKGLETAAAEKIKSDAQTFYKTNSPKLIELKCTFIMVKVETNSLDEYSNTKTMPEKEFFAAESLCCEPPRMCQDCRGCQECGFRGATLSLNGNKELQVVEDSNWFDKKLDKWRVKDAFQLAPRVLRSNYRRVLRMSETTERRLDKIGKKNEASELFNKMIKVCFTHT